MSNVVDWFARVETALFERLGRKPLSGRAERGSFWLLVLAILLILLAFAPGVAGDIGSLLACLDVLALICFAAVLIYRWVFNQVLWTVRNRLTLTYLLMGLAPLVLFGTLTLVVAYVLSGQFATDTAIAALTESQGHVKDVSDTLAAPIGHALELDPQARRVTIPEFARASAAMARQEGLEITAWQDGVPIALQPESTPGEPERKIFAASGRPDHALPGWAHVGFSGVVQDGGRLYLRAVSGYEHVEQTGHARSPSGQGTVHSILILASVPLGRSSMNTLGEGLGMVKILPGIAVHSKLLENDGTPEKVAGEAAEDRLTNFSSVQGGTLASGAYFFDTRVFFTAPLHFVDWQSGKVVPAMIGVISRPTVLYQRLFATSVLIGTIVRNALIAIALVFALLELAAFLMALRLSRTITQSVADLYGATTQLDGGNFKHRIQVGRRDQLAALATSFNTMAGSLEELLEQQREKERIQSELEIAQEVQKNLFPHAPIHLANFEVHGICKPARTVSGDYYDFIRTGDAQLCLALGDISGKGISAALLMASLHSAVRAYHAAGASVMPASSLVGVGSSSSVYHPGDDFETADPPGVLNSPGQLLALLNRHLYSSTQPAKYATLFLACYDSRTRQLRYSNGGQLPPLLLCADGSVKRLDHGGSVVGLLPGMEYEEATVTMDPGDLLVAYSDGVTEPENEFGEFGEERLMEVIRRERHQSLATISNQTMRALRNWIGDAEQPDDITLVLARQL